MPHLGHCKSQALPSGQGFQGIPGTQEKTRLEDDLLNFWEADFSFSEADLLLKGQGL